MNKLLKVLVVDDEHIIADTLKLILSQGGYEAKVAYRADTTRQISREFLPDLVILDMFLPDGNGFDLAKELRNAFPRLQILMLSGQVATEELIHSAREAQVDLMSKPVNPRELMAKIHQMFRNPGSHQAA